MTFDTIVFGSFIVGTGFADGASIPSGGLRCFIKPTANMGPAPLDVTITYIDQFGNPAETTTVSTSVAANTTSGSHIEITLNTGDTGIRDIISVSVVGGTAGDRFNLESWNEGLGKTFQPIVKSNPDPPYLDSEPIISTVPLYHKWLLGEHLDLVTLVNLLAALNNGISDANYTLATEVIEPDYVTECNKFGFLEPTTFEEQSNQNKQLKVYLNAGAVSVIDANEPSTRFKWKWNQTQGQYEDSGFFKIDFDFSLNRGSLFTFEVLDKAGAVKFSRASNTGGWTVPSAVNSYCGQELLYPAGNVRDNNLTTEWRHSVDEYHWIIIDMGSSRPLGGVRFYLTGTGYSGRIDAYISDDPAFFATLLLSDEYLGILGGARWYQYEWIPQNGRYMKIIFKPLVSGDPPSSMSDIREIQGLTLEHVTLSFPDLAWEMRFRVSANGNATGNEYVDIRNIKITRYKLLGTATSNFPVNVPNIQNYDEILFTQTEPSGTNLKYQLAFSDDGVNWSEFAGPDGTGATSYEILGEKITVPFGYTGYYYRWRAIFTGDGRYTPTFEDISIWMFVKIWKIIFALEKPPSDFMSGSNPQMRPTIPLVRKYPRITPGMPNYPGYPPDWYYPYPQGKMEPEEPLTALINKVGGISSAETVIIYDNETDKDNFSTGDSLIIDAEIMTITAVDPAGKTITVARAQKGTIASAHSDNAVIIVPLNPHTAIVHVMIRGFPRLTPGMPNYPAEPPDWIYGHPAGKINLETPIIALVNKPGGIGTGDVQIPYDSETDLDNFSIGDSIVIDNEFMLVTGMNILTKILTVARAQKGTIAAAHADNSQIINPSNLYTAKFFELAPTWLESIVGQVLSGYARDQNENIIKNGLKIIITSTYAEGRDQMGAVNPVTGFFQVFVKNTKYDDRYLTVMLSGKTYNVTYKKYGNPALIDGTGTVPSPQDLHFWKPDQICGKSVAYVGSQVTY